MATHLKNLSEFNQDKIPSAEDLKFAIVVAEWNTAITNALLEGCKATLLENGCAESNIIKVSVPGSFELVAGAKYVAESAQPDAIIGLGCIIKGETKHDEYIAHAVAKGLTDLNLKYDIPFIFGVLTTNNEQEAKDRAGGKHGNKGVEAAVTAIRMAVIRASF